MHTTQIRVTAILTAVLILAATRAALADNYSRLELDDTSIGFSSPGNAYGPWIFQNARYVYVMPGQGAINVEFSHQANGDANFPTHGDYFAAGYTRDLSSRVYGYLNFGYGTSNPYAKTDIHAELNYKASEDMRLVLNGSEDFVTYWSGQTLALTQLGPTYYYHGGDIQAHFLAEVNSKAATQNGAYVAWDIVPDRRSKYTFTGLFGPQQYLVSLPGLPLTLANYTGQTYTLSTEQQIGRTTTTGLKWGVRAGGFLSQMNQAIGGAPVYTGRGATFGFWTTY